jgi:predicted transcriptional regulator
LISAILLGSSGEKKKQNGKNSTKVDDLDLTQDLPEPLQQSFQGIRKEIQLVQESTKDLQLMMRGMHAEIQELKKTTKRMSQRYDNVFATGVIRKASKPHIKEISTGLDFLESIPQHLRETFQAILKRDKGATALQIAEETGKSRSLASDYLNQLENRGFIYKKRQGKKVLFSKIGEPDEEDEEEIHKPFTHKKSFETLMDEKQSLVNNANHSRDKRVSINIDDK